MARTMLCENNLPKYFWAEAISTACYITNRALIKPILHKTPYELFKGKKPNISHVRPFDSKCFIHNNGKKNLGKFDSRSGEGIFLGYSPSSIAYRVFNMRTPMVEESVHVIFDEANPIFNKDNQNEYEMEILNKEDGTEGTIPNNDKEVPVHNLHIWMRKQDLQTWKYILKKRKICHLNPFKPQDKVTRVGKGNGKSCLVTQ